MTAHVTWLPLSSACPVLRRRERAINRLNQIRETLHQAHATQVEYIYASNFLQHGGMSCVTSMADQIVFSSVQLRAVGASICDIAMLILAIRSRQRRDGTWSHTSGSSP